MKLTNFAFVVLAEAKQGKFQILIMKPITKANFFMAIVILYLEHGT